MNRLYRLQASVSFVMAALLTGVCIGAESADGQQSTPYKRDPKRFEKSIQAFEATDQTMPPSAGAILCVGSSSMRGWHQTIHSDLAPLTIIPRGFGGSNMNDALHYVDRIVLPYKPRAIVLYEGDNDISYDGITPIKFKDTYRAFVDRVHARLPTTRIYFLSIKPSIRRMKFWPKMIEANALIAKECAGDKRLIYVDVAAGMLDERGKLRTDIFKKDNLHMNAKGYAIWREILRPVLIKSEQQFERKDRTSQS